MKPRNVPAPEYNFGYRNKPRSGNEINGLNQSEYSLAKPVFHSTGRGGGRHKLDWQALDTFFNLIARRRIFLTVIRTLWQRRNYAGPVAAQRIQVDDPRAMARRIKEKATFFGAGIAGVTEVADNFFYDRYPKANFKYAISLGLEMNRAEMEHVPHDRSAEEVMRTYGRGSLVAIKLARYIRSLGWPAQAYADGEDILQIPMAVSAGLGELGKHGSVISREFGSNFRLAAVLTDLPLACDAPIDIGVDDLCINCQRCTIDCPPDAINDEKQMVRGVEKWYVNFDKCIHYFTKTQGCAICIEVCPWSTPGKGTKLSEMLLAKRPKRSETMRATL